MSALIDVEKLKFSVFGHGFEDERNDSGEGVEEDSDRYAMGASSAVFDSTGQYAWIGCYGNGHSAGLLKYDMDDDFNELVHSVPTSSTACVVLHASNVANNYGLVIQGTDYIVFDLTNDTVVASGSDANLSSHIMWNGTPYDCYLDGTKFLISQYLYTQSTGHEVVTIDYSANTVTYTTTTGAKRAGGGFINQNYMYLHYSPEWFYQNKYIEAVNMSGSQLWGYQAPQTGDDGFANVHMGGFGKNGKLYCPTKIYGSWRLGEYNGLSVPNFNAPKPKAIIGKAENKFSIKMFAFTHEKTRVAFTTPELGIFVTDFKDLEKISDDTFSVLAISDKYIIADESGFHINVYKYG